jgi:hypothetical protein
MTAEVGSVTASDAPDQVELVEEERLEDVGRRIIDEKGEQALEGPHLLAHGDGPRAVVELAGERPPREPSEALGDRFAERGGIADVEERRQLALRHRSKRSRSLGGHGAWGPPMASSHSIERQRPPSARRFTDKIRP